MALCNTFIDLFCGIGGFRLGMQACGLRCVWSCDIDKTVRNVYFDNYGERPAGDIRIFREEDIPPHDVICGGFPCQSFSKAGKKAGFDSENGQLIYEVLRIAKYHKPKILLLENVPNIKNIDEGQGLVRVCKLFEEIGYNCQWFELKGSEFGIPQLRTRIYFLFIRNDIFEKVYISYEVLRRAMWETHVIEDILDPLDEVPEDYWVDNAMFELFPTRIQGQRSINSVYCGVKRLRNDGKGTLRHETSCGCRVYSDKGVMPTLTTRGNFIWDSRRGQVRFPTPKELLKLQGFPVDFKIPEKSALRLVGNSVIPRMVELVYKMIKIKQLAD